MNESLKQEHLKAMTVLGATADELRNTQLRWEHEDSGQPYDEFDKRFFKGFETTGAEARIIRMQNAADLSKYLYFDARAYYQYEIEQSAAVVELLKKAGTWNEHTQHVHELRHSRVVNALEDYENAPPQIKAGIRKMFLSFLRVVKNPTKEELKELIANSPAAAPLQARPQPLARQEEPAEHETKAGPKLKDVLL